MKDNNKSNTPWQSHKEEEINMCLRLKSSHNQFRKDMEKIALTTERVLHRNE